MIRNCFFQNLSKKNLQFVRCECGEEILLVPNAREMDRAIELHANKHALKENNPERAEASFKQIQQDLVQKTLLFAAMQNEQSIASEKNFK
jgi:hypothetical protein